MKTFFIVLGIIAFIIFVAVISTSSPPQKINQATNQPSPSKENVSKQLEDVNKKISELPELENDIFSKCMETTKGTADDI